MDPSKSNSLIASSKSTDSGLQALLHPLALLTVSDYITRHTLRNQEGPIVGALIGQQNSRKISVDHAFECKLDISDSGVIINQTWFEERVQQYRDVHKEPFLDLVGWFTLTPTSGPQPHHLPIHEQILEKFCDAPILLAFHPDGFNGSGFTGGKLPLTIYEGVRELEGSAAPARDPADTDKIMTVDGEESQMKLLFRELPYRIESGEAEMIGVDFIARAAGNPSAVDVHSTQNSQKEPSDRKGKAKAAPEIQDPDAGKMDDLDQHLSSDDKEVLTFLKSKMNAIRMLQNRIRLLIVYLESLPQHYLTDKEALDSSFVTSNEGAPPSAGVGGTEIDFPILRSIQAILNCLMLVQPPDTAAFNKEMTSEMHGVSLIALMATMTRSLKDLNDLNRKFKIVEGHRHNHARKSHHPAETEHPQPISEINPSILRALGDFSKGTKGPFSSG
ncbi:MAG: hypothetical protein M1829_005622 [Trizodia sp. TS-e1964]|nr:MAG: hypothetical protein M1829_005622 [Trizodia sp. TS-e1964]